MGTCGRSSSTRPCPLKIECVMIRRRVGLGSLSHNSFGRSLPQVKPKVVSRRPCDVRSLHGSSSHVNTAGTGRVFGMAMN